MDFYKNLYEADIAKNQQLLKRLEENPGWRLKSYRIYLENAIKTKREQLEGWRQGRPFFDQDSAAPRFFRAMGFLPLERGWATMPRHLDYSGARSVFVLKERAHAMGLPVETACDQTYGYASVVDAGDMPDESIVYCGMTMCPMRVFQKLFIVHQLGKWPNSPIFCLDRPPEDTEASLEYIVDQLREFIEVAEKKFPGVIKYDEAKLIEYQDTTEAVKPYYNEIYEMRKHQPSPIAGRDITETTDWEYRNVEYARAKRDEVAERLEKGVAAIPGEKLRVLWNGTFVRYMDPFDVLAKWQVAVLFWFVPESMFYTAPWPTPAYYGGRKLTPLEEEARWLLSQGRGGTAVHWIDNMIRICRDLKIDAIINGQQLGATCDLGFKRLVEERAEKELGIPTLHLEFKRWDPSYADEATLTAKLDEFAQMCLASKGLA